MSMIRTCQECGRVFDLYEEIDAEEWFYGHDCEEDPVLPSQQGPRISEGDDIYR